MRGARKGVSLVGLIVGCLLTGSTTARAQFETRGRFVADSDSSPVAIAVGDFNHDGKLDLAVVSYCCAGSGVSILLGRGDGTFEPGAQYAAGDQPFSIVAADFDGDGNDDIIYTRYDPREAVILFGDGKGGFTRSTVTGIKLEPNTNYDIKVADVNGDGRPDVILMYESAASTVLASRDGSIQVFLNRGVASAATEAKK